MSWEPGIYFGPGSETWIRVCRYGSHWRAGTNYHTHDRVWYYRHIDSLHYRETREEAQQDLDALAAELNLRRVEKPSKRDWED